MSAIEPERAVMRERLLSTVIALALVVLPIALLSRADSLARSQPWLAWLSRPDQSISGTPVNEAEAVGFAPLHVAALTGDIRSATELLSGGANVNVLATRRRTPLYLAAAAGRAQVVEVLLRAGADPTIRADNGLRPIDAAQSAGHEEIVHMLTRSSAAHIRAVTRPLLRIRA